MSKTQRGSEVDARPSTTATTAATWRGNHNKGPRHAQEYLQSATTSLEAFSTSLNCDGEEILTVFDILAVVGRVLRRNSKSAPRQLSGTWVGNGWVGLQHHRANPTSASGES